MITLRPQDLKVNGTESTNLVLSAKIVFEGESPLCLVQSEPFVPGKSCPVVHFVQRARDKSLVVVSAPVIMGRPDYRERK